MFSTTEVLSVQGINLVNRPGEARAVLHRLYTASLSLQNLCLVLSTDADSSTDTIVGWTKNTPNPNFFFTENIIQNAKTQKHLEICKN